MNAHSTTQRTHKLQQLDHRFAGNGADVEPISYAVDAPLDGFVVPAVRDMRVVDAEELCGLGVSPGALVNRDEVEDTLMGVPVHCEAESDGHCDGPSAYDCAGAGRKIGNHVHAYYLTLRVAFKSRLSSLQERRRCNRTITLLGLLYITARQGLNYVKPA